MTAASQTWISENNHKGKILQLGTNQYSVENLPVEEAAERNFLGIAILISQNDPKHNDLNQFIPWLESEDFYFVRHAYIHRAMFRIWEREEAITIDTVASELRRHNLLDGIGGETYLTDLVKVSNLQMETYARMVKRASAMRHIIATGTRISRIDPTMDISDITMQVDGYNREIIRRVGALAPNSVRGDVALEAGVKQIVFDANNPNFTPGLSTGYQSVDKHIIGLRKRELLTIAAPPGWGKSMACLNMTMNVVRNHPNKRVLYIALEDPVDRLIERVVSAETRIDGIRIKKREFYGDEIQNMLTRAAEIAEMLSRVEFAYMMMPSMKDIDARILTSMRDGLDLVVIDWAHARTVSTVSSDESKATAEIFGNLREMKSNTDLPFMVATQMNRNYSSRSDPRPQMSDLAWSSVVEQVSDIVMFVYLPHEVDPMEDKHCAEWIFRKNRSSSNAIVPLRYRSEFSVFDEMDTQPDGTKYEQPGSGSIDLSNLSPSNPIQ